MKLLLYLLFYILDIYEISHQNFVFNKIFIFIFQISQSDNVNNLQLSGYNQKPLDITSQTILEEIYQRYKNLIVTKQRYNQLLNRIHKQLYEIDFDQEQSKQLDSRYIIEVIRQLDSESPLIFIDDQILPYTNHKLVPVDFSSINNKEAYFCQKCHCVMYEGVSLNCQHFVCKKCLVNCNRQEMNNVSMNSIISSQRLENLVDQKFICPICNQHITYCQELNEINMITRKLQWHCCYDQCDFTGPFYDVIEHIQNCPYGQKELENHIEPWKQLVQRQNEEIIRLKQQLRAQLDTNQQQAKDIERRLSIPLEQFEKEAEAEVVEKQITFTPETPQTQKPLMQQSQFKLQMESQHQEIKHELDDELGQLTPKDLKYISSLDYDICFLNLLRYVFYGNNFKSLGRLERICCTLRQYLINGANQNISVEIRLDNLKSFVSILVNFYAFMQSNTEFFKYLVKHYQPMNNLQNSRILSTFVKTYDQQDRIIQGGYVTKTEFGQQARKWLLEMIQKDHQHIEALQRQIKELQRK